MTDREFYWRDFLYEVHLKLCNLVNQLHNAYEKRNDFIYYIKANINEYNKVGIDVSVVLDIDNRNKIYFNKKQEDKLSTKLISYLKSYNYIVYEKLDKLDNEIRILSTIKEIPREMYTLFQSSLNFEIGNSLVKGNNYSFGGQVGYVYAYFHKLAPGVIPNNLNWGETMKLKKRLLEQGIAIKTPTNPNGVPYRVYYDFDWFIHARFHKLKNRIKQASYYKFKFAYSSSCYAKYTNKKTYAKGPKDFSGKTFEEILNNRRISPLNKILAICVNLQDLPAKLYKNNLNQIK